MLCLKFVFSILQVVSIDGVSPASTGGVRGNVPPPPKEMGIVLFV